SLLTDWYIKTGSLGQPILTHVHGFDKQYTISLSHSFQAAAAFAFPHAYPSGIDVENILRKTPTSLIVSQCLEAEKKLFDIENRLEAFCFWTAKEAISKVFMIGLTVNTTLYEIISFQQLTSNTWRIRFKNFKPYQVICVYQHPIIYAVAIHESAEFL
ncbi:MAG: 4'-phosphopantetheinyl transferase superfamily protein, partial [Limnohabitans sp.]|nr:4'-phosphopantetheinyl transferase superfamily protein [Limnohabitans sp.]